MTQQSISRHQDKSAQDATMRELVTYLHQEEIVYIDLSLLSEWEQGLKRWPLLSEWNQWAKNMGF